MSRVPDAAKVKEAQDEMKLGDKACVQDRFYLRLSFAQWKAVNTKFRWDAAVGFISVIAACAYRLLLPFPLRIRPSLQLGYRPPQVDARLPQRRAALLNRRFVSAPTA
jgi:hypothetical protein